MLLCPFCERAGFEEINQNQNNTLYHCARCGYVVNTDPLFIRSVEGLHLKEAAHLLSEEDAQMIPPISKVDPKNCDHEFREIDQLDGYPGGDIVRVKCQKCGFTTSYELPQ